MIVFAAGNYYKGEIKAGWSANVGNSFWIEGQRWNKSGKKWQKVVRSHFIGNDYQVLTEEEIKRIGE